MPACTECGESATLQCEQCKRPFCGDACRVNDPCIAAKAGFYRPKHFGNQFTDTELRFLANNTLLEDCLNERMPAKNMYFRLPTEEYQQRKNDTSSVICVLKEDGAGAKARKLVFTWNNPQWRTTFEGQLYTGDTLVDLAMQLYFIDSRGMMGPIPGFFQAFVAPVFKGFK